MGADPRPGDGASFLVCVLRDPMGANLDRVQIVKGWLDKDGAQQEKVYDISWSGDRATDETGKVPAVGNTLDLSIPSRTDTIGAPQLGTDRQDPDFDPSPAAFSYARALEIPTPRWTAYDVVRFSVDLPPDVQVIAQERAYTSPIWYTPNQGRYSCVLPSHSD